jgi:hypothetical protein
MVRKLLNLARYLCSCVGPNGLVSEVELGLAGRRKDVRTTIFAIPLTWVTLLGFSSYPVATFGYALLAVSNRNAVAGSCKRGGSTNLDSLPAAILTFVS